jgi:hypothetical protein
MIRFVCEVVLAVVSYDDRNPKRYVSKYDKSEEEGYHDMRNGD